MIKFREIPGVWFLVSAILCFLLAATFRFVLIDYGYSKESIARNLESSVEKELLKTEKDLNAIWVGLEPNRIVDALLPQITAYPYYIFRNGTLEYWSDYAQVPSYFELANNREFQFLRLRNGYHLARKAMPIEANSAFEVYFLIPVFYSPGIENQYLRPYFNEALIKYNYFTVLEDPSTNPAFNISYQDQFLFSIDFPENFKGTNPLINALALAFSLFALLFFFLFLRKLSNLLKQNESYWEGLFILVIALGIVRFLMLSFSFPFSGALIGLFNPRNYASSFLNPSLGDLIINILVVIWVVWYAFDVFFRPGFLKGLKAVGQVFQVFLPIILAVASYFGLFSIYFFAQNISGNSQWSLDITSNLYLGYLRWISMGVLSLCGLIYFLFAHLYFRSTEFVFQEKERFRWAYFGISALVCIFPLFIELRLWPISIIYLLYNVLI